MHISLDENNHLFRIFITVDVRNQLGRLGYFVVLDTIIMRA